jgi:hypothetical protein
MDNERIKIGNNNPFEKKQEIVEPVAPATPVAGTDNPFNTKTPTVVAPAIPNSDVIEKPSGIPAAPAAPVIPAIATEKPVAPAEPKTPATPEAPKLDANGKPVAPETPVVPVEGEFDGVYHKVGQFFKEDGFIGKDVEIPEDADGATIYNLYKEANEQRLVQDVTQKTQATVMQQLQDTGVNQEHLSMALMLSGGTSNKDILDHNVYKTYADMKADEVSNEDKLRVIRAGLSLTLKPERVEKYVAGLTLEDDDSAIDEEFTQYQEDFGKLHKDFVTVEKEKALNRAKHLDTVRQDNDKFLNDVFTTSSINGETLSETQLRDFREALSTPTTTVEKDGQKFQATEFQAFTESIKTDFRAQLYVFKMLKYRKEELAGLVGQAKQELEKDFLGRMPVEVEVDKTNKNKTTGTKSKKKDWHNFGRTVYKSHNS